ncbi:hypothetical protein J7T55_013756 [Diaporthe amygdali]|uniref:uncharacterized protein n=1 Tax=Phomopsis amygdali TaxID=1214568 RepID=UPI0022FE967B|nr:uncharacterized protein J7T55_013756 [Diaporthe amygdali]KAJ0119553.1 hypothetical protein J7T55_013756 [Diaporthe amygdali]
MVADPASSNLFYPRGGCQSSSASTTISSSASPTPSALSRLAKFPCDELAFETQSQTLYAINLTTGFYYRIGPATLFLDTVNALAYHPQENYLYAIAQRNSAYGYIVRIGAGGTYETVPNGIIEQTGFNPPVSINVGEMDLNYNYWLAQNNGKSWVQVDLNSSSSTYGRVINNGTTNMAVLNSQSTNYVVADWAYLPAWAANKLYSLGKQDKGGGTGYNTHLLQWDMTTKNFTQLVTYPDFAGGGNGTASWGAMYSTNDGFLYATENTSGRIYKFDISNPNASGYTFVSQGPAGSANDGARCQNGPPPASSKKKRTGGLESGHRRDTAV